MLLCNCIRAFNNLSAYSKHVKSHELKHSSMQRQATFSHALQDSNDDYKNSVDVSYKMNKSISDSHVELCEVDNSNDFHQALTNAVITYVASLYDNFSLSEDEIQKVIDCHKTLLGAGFLIILKKHVFKLLDKARMQKEISVYEMNEITRMFDSCQNMFNGFESHYLRIKQFESCGSFIKPETYVIGTTLDEKNFGGEIAIVPTLVTGQFIPLRLVLKGFLELPNVLKIILDHMKTLEDNSDSLCNIIRGKLWKEKIAPKFLDKVVLPLILYFDDYETNKELGSHTGVHKLGATYCRIACLPPQFQSSLENVFLVNLFHSTDKVFGNANIFRKVLNELKYLEDTGITVVTENEIIQVYFAMCLFTGDNLGANSTLGYVESFSANNYCRICKEHKKVMQKQTISNPLMRRNVINYNADLTINNSTETGIKSECIFNELRSFHVVENIHVDIMHDLDEGMWKETMTCVINILIERKKFDIDTLNNLIQGFYYGPSEQRNKPPLITKDHNQRIKLAFSASEMRCFIRYFGLMVGHLIFDNDADIWKLYQTARHIIDILTAPFISITALSLLKDLIKQHHLLYLNLFDKNLMPKMHISIHYPDIIPEIGPLEPLSCIRMEAKHREGKQIAHSSTNRINLPYSITKRHQLKFCCRLLAGRGLSLKISFSSVQTVNVTEVKEFSKFCHIFSEDICSTKWNIVKWIKINNSHFVTINVPFS